MPQQDTRPAPASATPTAKVNPESCECDEPDGDCDACGDEHGHTCIMCGYDFCVECWETDGHNDGCKREVYDDDGIVYAENVKRGAADS